MARRVIEGALVGCIIGAFMGVLIGIAMSRSFDGRACAGADPNYIALLGAIVGLAIGATIKYL